MSTVDGRSSDGDRRALLRRRLRAAGLAAASGPEPVRRRTGTGPAPLTAAQSRMWLHQQRHPDSCAYLVPLLFTFTGPVSGGRLRRAWERVVDRHAALRTTFPIGRDGVAHQVVHERLAPAWTEPELGEGPVDQRAARFRAVADGLARRPFDLAVEGPLRLAFGAFGADPAGVARSALAVVVHHIAWDGVTFGILSAELSAAYAADGAAETAPGTVLDTTDVAVWEQEQCGTAADRAAVEFWRAELAGDLALAVLPRDHPAPARPSERGVRVDRIFPPGSAAALRGVAAATATTPYVAFLACQVAVLHRVTGSPVVPVGTAVLAHRDQAALRAVVGNLGNTVVVRTDLTGAATFAELAARVRDRTDAVRCHEQHPFDRVVAALPTRSGGERPALFEVLTLFLTQDITGPVLPGVDVDWERLDNGTAQYPLALEVFLCGDRLEVQATAATDVLDPATVADLLEHLQVVLQRAAHDPAAALDVISAPPEAAKRAVRADLTGPPAPRPPHLDLAAWLTATLAAAPRETALIHGAGRTSRGALLGAASRLARLLIAEGVGPESVVAIVAGRGPDLVRAQVAVLLAGGACLPIDPTQPPDRVALLLDRAAPTVVLAAAGADVPDRWTGPLVAADDPAVAARLAAFSAEPLDDRERRAVLRPAHPAYVVFTSGSTGLPKAVLGTHAAVVARLAWALPRWQTGARDVRIARSAPGFIDGVTELWAALVAGVAVVLADDVAARDTAALARLIAEHAVTQVTTVPTAARALAELDPAALTSVRRWVCSGEPLHPDVLAVLAAATPAAVVVNSYGSSEVAGDVTTTEFTGPPQAGVPPLGRPVPGVVVHVLDAALRPVPRGAVGELYVCGDQVARGYRGDPARTAERFVADPNGAGRMYRTGDLVRLRHDGELEFRGRADGQLSVRGHRLEPGEVETVLAAAPGVAGAAVAQRRVGGDAAALVGFLVADTGAVLDPAAVRAFTAARLPAHAVPVRVVVLDALPRNPHGKLDRSALPTPQAAPAPTGAPRTARQALLVELFGLALGGARLGVHDSFFDHGGHSLLAARLVALLRDRLAVDLPLAALFDAPTPAALDRVLDDLAGPGRSRPVTLASRPDRIPLAPAQERMWVQAVLDGPDGVEAHRLRLVAELTGPVDPAALAAALGDVVDRHEALRTVFPDDDGVPRQEVLPPGAWRPTLHPVAPDRVSQRPGWDIAVAPPLTAQLVRHPDRHTLLLDLHHLVGDEASVAPFLTDLTLAYAARCAGTRWRPDPLPLQYADYACWQRSVLAEQGPDAPVTLALAHWRAHLAGLPEDVGLPRDRPRPDRPSGRAGTVAVDVPDAVAAGLRTVGRATGATEFMVLAAACAVTLSRLGAGPDVPVGIPTAGRDDVALADLVGCLVGTTVLRVDLSGSDRAGPTFRDVVGRVRTEVLTAHEHRDLPFDRIVSALGVPRLLGRTPLFQTMVVLAASLGGPRPFGAAVLTPTVPPTEGARFDLELRFAPGSGGADEPTTADGPGLTGTVVYATDLFDQSTATRIARTLADVLAAAATHPDRPLDVPPVPAGSPGGIS